MNGVYILKESGLLVTSMITVHLQNSIHSLLEQFLT